MNDFLAHLKFIWGAFAFLMNFTAIIFFCGLMVFTGAKIMGALSSLICHAVSKITRKKISLDQFEFLQQLFLMAYAILLFIAWIYLVGKAIAWFGLDNLWKAGFIHFS